jgi:hypothetical protein
MSCDQVGPERLITPLSLAARSVSTSERALIAIAGHQFWRTRKPSIALEEESDNAMQLNLDFQILTNLRPSMKSSTLQIREPDGFGCFPQIVAHLGGMTRAWFRHRPIHFAFHWRGICRAILAGVMSDSQAADRS